MKHTCVVMNPRSTINNSYVFHEETHYNNKIDKYFMYTSYLMSLHDQIFDKQSIKYQDINPNEVLYVSKSSQIPRYKLKEFLIQNPSITRTRLIPNATLIIYDTNHLPNILSKANIEYLKKYKLKNDEQKHYIIPFNDFKILHPQAVIKNKGEYVLISKSCEKYCSFNINQYPCEYIELSSGYGYTNQSQHLEHLEKILQNTNTRFINDTEFQSKLTKNNYIIDDEQYKSLRLMLGSKDKDSIRLATEVIANSNYENSKLYIILLLNEFNAAIWRISYSTNFKAMLSYFINVKYKVSWQDCVKELYKTFTSPQETQIIIDYIQQLLEHKFKDDIFKINNITLK